MDVFLKDGTEIVIKHAKIISDPLYAQKFNDLDRRCDIFIDGLRYKSKHSSMSMTMQFVQGTATKDGLLSVLRCVKNIH